LLPVRDRVNVAISDCHLSQFHAGLQFTHARNKTPRLRFVVFDFCVIPFDIRAQGFAIEFGQGRVVVLGEAGMLTAQIEGKERFGMNAEGLDYKQFALNVVHWLSRLL
jgi:hypothetical protein